jgi:hypothetical protein
MRGFWDDSPALLILNFPDFLINASAALKEPCLGVGLHCLRYSIRLKINVEFVNRTMRRGDEVKDRLSTNNWYLLKTVYSGTEGVNEYIDIR